MRRHKHRPEPVSHHPPSNSPIPHGNREKALWSGILTSHIFSPIDPQAVGFDDRSVKESCCRVIWDTGQYLTRRRTQPWLQPGWKPSSLNIKKDEQCTKYIRKKDEYVRDSQGVTAQVKAGIFQKLQYVNEKNLVAGKEYRLTIGIIHGTGMPVCCVVFNMVQRAEGAFYSVTTGCKGNIMCVQYDMMEKNKHQQRCKNNGDDRSWYGFIHDDVRKINFTRVSGNTFLKYFQNKRK